ncbi:MAG: ABC-type transport auxiliary lipoprotein family protein [Gammaproteobacteria bacterium]
MTRWRMALPCLLALAAGCTLIKRDQQALAIYDLRPAGLAIAPGPASRWQLLIDEPAALEPVAGARIATRTPEGALGVLAGGRWRGTAPRVLQSLLLDAFRQSGRIVGVSQLGSGVPGDCTLVSTLRDFQYEQRSRAVRISLAASLVCGQANGIVASRTFAGDTAVKGSGITAVVDTFQQGMAALAPEIVDWALAAGDAAITRSAAPR